MLTYLIEHVNIVRLYVDMWRSVDIHVVGDIHVNILSHCTKDVKRKEIPVISSYRIKAVMRVVD